MYVANSYSDFVYNTDVVVVNCSACSPSTPTIQVRIPQKPTVLSVNLCLKRTNINKRVRGWTT